MSAQVDTSQPEGAPQRWEARSVSVEQTIGIGESLAPLLAPNDVVLLVGDLGAGKTHLTKGVARGLGCSGRVTSPTFNIVLIYDDGRLPLYHFDLYRLDDAWQLDDIDYFGLIEEGGASLVEWGDKFPDALPPAYLELRMEVDYGGEGSCSPTRVLRIEGHGARGRELARAWAAACQDLWHPLPPTA